MAPSLGKMPTTWVRRLTSALSCSSGLVEWIGVRCALGEIHEGQHVVLGLVHQRGGLGELGAQLVGDRTPLHVGRLGVVLGKGRGDGRADHAPPALAGGASTLRRKCTRQRCQVALNTLPTAALRPTWASLMTSFTPRRPRRVRRRRKSVQNGSASLGMACMPSTWRWPSVFTATAIIVATLTIRPT